MALTSRFQHIWYLTIGSRVFVRMSRFEARERPERDVRIAREAAENNTSFLSALQISQVLHFLTYIQLKMKQFRFCELLHEKSFKWERMERSFLIYIFAV